MNGKRIMTAGTFAILFLTLPTGRAQTPQARLPPMKPLHPLDESYLVWQPPASEKAYGSIDGNHLKQYVEDQAAISRRYRDKGHQFWGRITGTEADEENAQWMMDKFRKAGLSDIRQQNFVCAT